jgi:ArsR family transcriptional regulator
MDHLLTLLRAAAEDTRLRILALAAREDLTVSDYVHVLGQSQPRVSRHLKLLVEAGLLERFREAQFTRFRLVTSGDDAALVREFVRRLDPKHARIAADRSRLDALQQRRQTAAVRFFRDNAQRWDELRALHVADREIERALAHHLPVGARRLLDIGTGTGRLLEVLAPKVEQAIGVDQSREMLALARANLAKAGIDNADIRQGDMYALPFESDAFDVVTIHHVLHYADDPAAALAEAARVVRPGGIVLVVDFSPHDLVELKREHAHVHLGFADNQVQGWLKSAGLNPLEPIHFPGRRIMTGIWRGERELPARTTARHVTHPAHGVSR